MSAAARARRFGADSRQKRHSQGGDARQVKPVEMYVCRTVECVAQQLRQFARRAVGNDARAFDQAGIAVARFLAGAATVNKDDGAAALL